MWGASRGRDAALLGAGLGVVALLYWVFGQGELMAALRAATPLYLVFYLLCTACVLCGLALRWRSLAGAVGGAEPLLRLIAARIAGDAVAALVPSAKLAGDPVRAALVYRGGQNGTRATAGVAIDRVVEMVSNSLCAVAYVAVFSLARSGGASHDSLLMLLGVMLALLIALAALVVRLRRGRRPLAALYAAAAGRQSPKLRRVLEMMRQTEDHLIEFFRAHPGAFARGVAFSLLIEGMQILQFDFLLRSFGLDLEIPTLLMVLLAGGLARAVPTPASLGALETGEVAVLAAAAGRADLGFVVGIVMRLHDTVWTVAGLIVLSAGWAVPGARAAAPEA